MSCAELGGLYSELPMMFIHGVSPVPLLLGEYWLELGMPTQETPRWSCCVAAGVIKVPGSGSGER